jgi:hypothetical protein
MRIFKNLKLHNFLEIFLNGCYHDVLIVYCHQFMYEVKSFILIPSFFVKFFRICFRDVRIEIPHNVVHEITNINSRVYRILTIAYHV